MSYLLIGGVIAVGYWLNRNGKTSRLTREPPPVPRRDVPSGPNIYESNRVAEVADYMRQLAAARYPLTDPSGIRSGFGSSCAISPLTGLPADMSHGNMQPHFGQRIKQPSISNGAQDAMLDRMYGAGSALDLLQQRTEQAAPPLVPQNTTALSPALLTDDSLKRLSHQLGPVRNDLSSVPQVADIPLINSQVRAMPRSLDQTRASANPAMEYPGVIVPGQRGSAQALPSQYRRQRRQLSNAPRQLLPGAPKDLLQKPLVQTPRAGRFDSISTNHVGPPRDAVWWIDNEIVGDSVAAELGDSVTSKIERFGDIAINPESLVQYPAKGATVIFKRSPRDLPEFNDSKQVLNVVALWKDGMYRSCDMELPTTAREIDAQNEYVGPAHTGLDLPSLPQCVELDPTTKEQMEDGEGVRNPTSVRLHANLVDAECAEQTRDHVPLEGQGGFAAPRNPVGREMPRDFVATCKDEEERRLRFNNGIHEIPRERFSMGIAVRPDKERIGRVVVTRKLPSALAEPSADGMPLLTRCADEEVADNRLLDVVLPDPKRAIEVGHLPQQLDD
jgi:hypothetical protein